MLPTHLDLVRRQIEDTLPGLANNYYRLALVVGRANSGKTRLLTALAGDDLPLVNVNLDLSRRLLEYTIAERPKLIPRFLADLIKEKQGLGGILLDNMELLFDASLHLNPLRILQLQSRNVTIIAAWNGAVTENTLVYAEPGHPEYQRNLLSPQDAVICSLGNPL